MITLKELAAMGHAIAVVIHQPRTSIFDMFDNLLLLEKGRVVYEGKACEVKNYLESCPNVQKLPPETGKADWLMDLITEDENRDGGSMLPILWEQSQKELAKPPQSLDRRQFKHRLSSIAELKQEQPKFQSGFFTQLKLLTIRASKQQRGERITRVAILLTFCWIAFISLAWGRMPDDTSYIFNRASLLFFLIIAQANSVVTSSIVTFTSERKLLSRERAKKLYGVLPYFLAKTAADMVTSIALPVFNGEWLFSHSLLLYSYLILSCCFQGMVVYWICNFRPSAEAFFTFILILYLTISAAQSTGLFMSVAIPTTPLALVIAPFVTLCLMILGGFYIPYEEIHPALSWASWVSMARYGFSAFIINEFDGRFIKCDATASQMLVTETGDCPLSGSLVVEYYGIKGAWTSIWANVAILVIIQVVLRCATYFILLKAK